MRISVHAPLPFVQLKLHVSPYRSEGRLYCDIRAEHVEPALKLRLEEAEAALAKLEAGIEAKLQKGVTPTYVELNDEAEQISESVFGPWGAVNHLKSVRVTRTRGRFLLDEGASTAQT